MRCHEARKRITDHLGDSPELNEHLANCTQCARFAAAERQITESLPLLRPAANEPLIPLAVLRQRIETKAAGDLRKEIPVMSSFVSQIRVHPRLTLGVALAVMLFLAVTLIPFSYQRIAGYAVKVEVPTTNAPNIQGALALLGHDNVSVNASVSDKGTTYQIGDFPSRTAAREAGAAVKALCGRQGTVTVTPVYETVSGSLYAQARDRIITIRIDSAGKSDSQLETEIAAKLNDNGFTESNVSVTTGADGSRTIKITGNNSTGQDSVKLQLEMNDTPGSNRPIGLYLVGDTTMTDAELKAELEAKLKAEGNCGANPTVTVTRRPDGKREVRCEGESK